MTSPTFEKIALFRSLFRGREDVLPRRWENPKTGKTGYSPVCRNEWVRGVCGKPQVKCSECPNQAFVPFSDNPGGFGNLIALPLQNRPRENGNSVFLDDLDTRFLTMPISWRGILAQYAGRLHRLYATKRDVLIYDYVDEDEPRLAKMATKREAGIGASDIAPSRAPNSISDRYPTKHGDRSLVQPYASHCALPRFAPISDHWAATR
jgi:hypothetical protein